MTDGSRDARTKTYRGWVLVDWRDDDLRFRKTKPDKSDRKPTEYPVKVELEVEVPELETPTLAAEICVPETQVKRVVYEDLQGASDVDVPDWKATAEEVVATRDDLRKLHQDGDLGGEEIVDALTGATLRKADGYPDPDEVQQYIDHRLVDLKRGDEA